MVSQRGTFNEIGFSEKVFAFSDIIFGVRAKNDLSLD